MKQGKEIKEAASRIFAENPHIEVLYVNAKGEFFTKENMACHSVENSKKEITAIGRSQSLPLNEIEVKQAEAVVESEASLSDVEAFNEVQENDLSQEQNITAEEEKPEVNTQSNTPSARDDNEKK